MQDGKSLERLMYGLFGGAALVGTLGVGAAMLSPKLVEKVLFYPSSQWDVLTLDTLHRYKDLMIPVPEHVRNCITKRDADMQKYDPSLVQYINCFWIKGQDLVKKKEKEEEKEEKEEEKEKRMTVIFAHGNAGNLTNRQHYMKHLSDLGYDVVVFDYRGFGKSTKNLPKDFIINQDTTTDDLEVVYDYATKRAGAENVVLYGESIGTGVIASFLNRVARRKNRNLKGVILQSGFTSIKAMALHLLPSVVASPLSFFVKSTFDSVENLKEACKKGPDFMKKLPFMVIHSHDDELVPFSQAVTMLENLELLGIDYTFYEIKGGHNCPEIGYAQIQKFVDEKIKN